MEVAGSDSFAMPAVSVIIPTKDSSGYLPRLLRSLESQTVSDFEVIVVDNSSQDDTQQLAKDWGALVEPFGPERSAQRNRGAQLARAGRVLFVDADMELTPEIVSATTDALPSADAVCYRELPIPSAGYLARARGLERELYFHSLIYEAARGFTKEVFKVLGGYDTTLTGLEDMDLQARVVEKGLKLTWVSCALLHHEEDVGTTDYLRKRGKYAEWSDARFKMLHPQYWNELTSPLLRGKCVLHNLKGRRFSDWALVPGMTLGRILEYGVRLPASRARGAHRVDRE